MKNKPVSIIAAAIILLLFSILEYNSIMGILENRGYNLNSSSYKTDSYIENQGSDEGVQQGESSDGQSGADVTEQSEVGQENPSEAESLKFYALSALLLDADNNRVLYEKSGYKEMPMASTTKIMTCIVALENGNLEDVVTVSKYASTMPDVQLNIREGEQYRLHDLLYSLMLESHNDSAVAIAEHIGGSVEGFASLMNNKAKELGCEHTNFVTPNGLDADGHQTTARDLAVIASYAIRNETFIEITNTPSWQFGEINNKRDFAITNKDRFLYSYSGAIGIKTGFTSKAGYCFVGAATKEDKTFISVVLGSGWPPNKNYKWQDTKLLMDYGFNNYKVRQIFDTEKTFEPVPVADGKKGSVGLLLDGNISLLMRDDESADIIYNVPEVLPAPVSTGEPVGKADYYVDDILYLSLPIYAEESVEKIDFKYCFEQILELWLYCFQ